MKWLYEEMAVEISWGVCIGLGLAETGRKENRSPISLETVWCLEKSNRETVAWPSNIEQAGHWWLTPVILAT
jgi:hypothetical protein